jgi:ferric-dicitrate binding protein FerR (iron transport regulator)
VRGTIYAVDVQAGRTSVFVARGRVAVQHREPSPSVILGAGQGVDVVPGRPLDVKTWGAERAAGLLARFGR